MKPFPLNQYFRRLVLTASFAASFVFCFIDAQGFTKWSNVKYEVSMPNPVNHRFHVQVQISGKHLSSVKLAMCNWTPGFYALINYSADVQKFSAYSLNHESLKWTKTSSYEWEINSMGLNEVVLEYDVIAENSFIANANLTSEYGYITPAALFMYGKENINTRITVVIKPPSRWSQSIATGLGSIEGKKNTFLASNFDELYDSPIMVGELETFPIESIQGKPLKFIAYNAPDFDRTDFMKNLKKLCAVASGIIGEIPFNSYTFLAVGLNTTGFGGIEHLNSSSILMSDNNNLLAESEQKTAFYALLAHEFFHLYNVKRIRPIELGPFDYSKPNYTTLLWLSEGFTDYYENLILLRAGLCDSKLVLDNFSEQIRNFENGTGKLYQTAVLSSLGIWQQQGQPTERSPEQVAKTISVYDKGLALGIFFDLKIRHDTKNAKSLDDVMRSLYNKYYKKLNRGFTEAEFRKTCEEVTGTDFRELFYYANSLAPLDYPKYFSYAGLEVDTTTKTSAQLSPGMLVSTDRRDSSLVVRSVLWNSPAYLAGIKKNDKIIKINKLKANMTTYKHFAANSGNNDLVTFLLFRNNQEITVNTNWQQTKSRSFVITQNPTADNLQKKIYNSWLSVHNPQVL